MPLAPARREADADRVPRALPEVRLEPGATGFANLSVVGEWTDTGVNISSIEATVISGMRASRALTGQPVNIPGGADV